MSEKKIPDLGAAGWFLAQHARVADRRVYERLFHGGAAGPVRDAVLAYRNDDGGFGHALEPDCRASASQPAAVAMALRLLDAADAWDDAVAVAACNWLASVAPAEGGAAFVEATLAQGPHAPWWVPEEGHPASLVQTGQLAGVLHARGVRHPWLDGATAVMWDMIDRLLVPSAYPLLGVCRFLDHVPDHDRARVALEKVRPLLGDSRVVALDPRAAGEVHGPLDFAPLPGSAARRLFDDAVIEAHLEHLAGAQREDGGWMFSWPSWSAAAEADWRGFLTVDALRVLRANRRLDR
ncbi:MAG TPA: hypothetical protein VMG38_20360 [Trebonia sp.]|nr:hypothetical protein [Trebonia sp.]